jgi:sugar lactone lactonase YvrE
MKIDQSVAGLTKMGFGIITFLCVICLSCAKSMRYEDGPGVSDKQLQIVFHDSVYQLTGVAVSNGNRVFTNYPQWSNIYSLAVAEVRGDSKLAYPDMDWNSWRPGLPVINRWVCVQAVHVDDSNFLWVVDPASPFQQGVVGNGQKLVKINLENNSVMQSYSLAGATDDKSYANDVRIDHQNQTAYLTNSSEGGIIIVNLGTAKVRQVLRGHYSVISDPAYTLTIDGEVVKKNGQVFKANSDGIALSPDDKYLYYKPLTDDKLYRIQTKYLLDTNLNDDTLGSKVEDLGHYTTTDGMVFDRTGNLYLGDLEHHRIMRIDSSLHMSSMLQDVRLIWPDSYQISQDNYLYISCSQINKQPDFNGGVNKRTTPYTIYKFKL